LRRASPLRVLAGNDEQNARWLAHGSKKSWRPSISRQVLSQKARPLFCASKALSHGRRERQKARGPFSAVDWSVRCSSSPSPVSFTRRLPVEGALLLLCSRSRLSRLWTPPSSLRFPSFKLFLSLFDPSFRVTHSSFRLASAETLVGFVALALEFSNPTNSPSALSSRRILVSPPRPHCVPSRGPS